MLDFRDVQLRRREGFIEHNFLFNVLLDNLSFPSRNYHYFLTINFIRKLIPAIDIVLNLNSQNLTIDCLLYYILNVYLTYIFIKISSRVESLLCIIGYIYVMVGFYSYFLLFIVKTIN